MFHLIRFALLVAIFSVALQQRCLAEERPAASYYLIGNSLTWDTVPSRLSGDVQWHVDCGISLPTIFVKTAKPCVETSTLWPTAFKEKQYGVISVQPHYGSTLSQDVETISHWMMLQPHAVFVIHSGWARHAQRADEFAGFSAPDQMAHGPIYLRALIAELQKLHPGRELRPTLAQNLLAVVAEDIAANRAPFKNIVELYRDDIHLHHDHGKYLMHNAMRRALGQPHSDVGFEKVAPEIKKYLDSVLAQLDISAADKNTLRQILSVEPNPDRTILLANITDKLLQEKVRNLLPEIERAAKGRKQTLALEAEIKAIGGKLICAPSGPQWLYLATGDRGAEIFDIPATVDLYNGNNPLKGKGGRNEQVTDDWLKHLANATTLRGLNLSNCAIQGPGLQHLARLTSLRELSLTLTPVNDEALRHLGGFTDLRVLSLASTQCTGTGFAHLKNLHKLENVNFHFTPLNDEGLEAISQVSITGRFWFAHTRFTDKGAAHLARLTSLKRCGIGSANKESSGEAVAALVKLPIEDLSLLDLQATPSGLAYAARIETLKKLDVSHAPTVNDDSLPLLAQLPKLEELKIGSAKLTDSGLQALTACKTLKKLSLTGMKGVTAAGVEQLLKARPDLVIEAK